MYGYQVSVRMFQALWAQGWSSSSAETHQVFKFRVACSSTRLNSRASGYFFFEFLKVFFSLYHCFTFATYQVLAVWIDLLRRLHQWPSTGTMNLSYFLGSVSQAAVLVKSMSLGESWGVPFCVVEATRMSGLAWSFLVFKTPQLTTKDSNFQEENFPRGPPLVTEGRGVKEKT